MNNAAKEVGVTSGRGGVTYAGVKDLALKGFTNAYKNLEIFQAEVYCFRDFVVMIDLAGPEREGK